MSDTEKQVRDDEQEISDEAAESVSGGITEGGCVIYPPIIKKPILTTTTTTF
ncbi:MAG TPA: hypothetical protein VFR81_23150 [Longimicrobium sp.]|nr:hypothetical protein [Longimicrobium sp.]